MLFQTVSFFYFFAIVFFVFHFALSKKNSKLAFLFISSLLFYGFLDYRYVPLLLFTSILDFYIAKAIQTEPSKKKRKTYLIFSLISNLSVLAIFKYIQFFTDTVIQLSNFLTGSNTQPPLFNILLPAGISFYTFQSMSYVIDIYRGQLASQRHPLEFLTAVSFFPHLIAGPIVRASTLLNQFGEKFRKLNETDFRNGLALFAVGFLKKGLGDMLALLVDPYFAGARPSDPAQTWLAALSFTGQIYADFSGYMDMAIGLALMLGFTLPESFDFPFLSRSPAEFWRRWNISLSLWFRDYLYIPLGGNRTHHLRNIFVTMFLSGLWHGASWNFIIWGIYYGILINFNILLRKYVMPFLNNFPATPLRLGQVILTFYFTMIGMMFIRLPRDFSLTQIKNILGDLTTFSFSGNLIYWLVFVFFTIIFTHVLDFFRKKAQERPLHKDGMVWVFTGIVFSLGLTLNGASHAFIYFQM